MRVQISSDVQIKTICTFVHSHTQMQSCQCAEFKIQCVTHTPANVMQAQSVKGKIMSVCVRVDLGPLSENNVVTLGANWLVEYQACSHANGTSFVNSWLPA